MPRDAPRGIARVDDHQAAGGAALQTFLKLYFHR